MSAPPQVALSGLARALVQHGRILEAEALACSSSSANPNDFLIELIKRGLMSAGDLARFAGQTFGSPIMDLAAYDVGHLPVDAIDRKLAARRSPTEPPPTERDPVALDDEPGPEDSLLTPTRPT